MLKGNWPLERHACKIYTRAMFENFGESLYKVGSHITEEVVHQRKYLVSHVDVVSRQAWCKVVFVVEVGEDLGEFVCECGFYAHAGMLCCHVVNV